MANTIIRGGSSTRVIIEPPSLADVLVRLDVLDAKLDALLDGGVIVTPTPTPTPTPTVLSQPTVSPSSAQQGSTFTATPGTYSNTSSVSRSWLLSGSAISSGLSAIPGSSGTLTYQETATGPGGSVQSNVISVAVTATLTPPTFTRSPAITTDGTPQVGEVAAFDFGDGTGTITSRLLRTDNSTIILADASVGSYQWANAGTYVLEVTRTLNGQTVTQSSSAVTVAAAVVSSIPAPVLSNPDDFVSGTNPPRVQIEAPYADSNGVPFDKSLHDIFFEWDNQSSGTFSVASARSVRITDSMAFFDKEGGEFSQIVKQPEGQPFRARARFIRKSDSVEGPNSNYFIDTMAAAQIPPTNFDPALAGPGSPYDAVRLSNNNRTAALGYALSNQGAWSTLARGIGAKVSFTFAGDTSTFGLLLGRTTVLNDRSLLMAPGYTEVNGNSVSAFDFGVNDTVSFELVANATTPANIDVLVSKNGGTTTRYALNSAANLFFGGFLSGDPGRTVTISDFTHWGTV